MVFDLTTVEIKYAAFDGDHILQFVGLYLGHGRYIHCSGLMRINSFDRREADSDAYLHNRLRAVRRILEY